MTEGTYKITNLGCKVNKAESVEIERQFSDCGYRRAVSEEVPEFWVVNTCAVTAAGMQKSRKAVRKCLKTGSKVIVTGCGVEFDSSEFNSLDAARLVSNLEKEKIVSEVCGLRNEGHCQQREFKIENSRIPVKVQDGCIQDCSYCIVPRLRTREWSMKKESVIEKVKFYQDAGAGEIILCGIDLGNYRDYASGEDLVGLARSVTREIPGIWVRLSSIGVRNISRPLIELFAENNGLCRHVHIPMQSGDDNVLRDMNRGYDRDYYLEKIWMIREILPDISITTDVMVGFPSESEDAFMNTVGMVREVGFSKVHIFRYSPRPDTISFVLQDPVSGKEKKRRARFLAEESRRVAEKFHSGFIGKAMDVLVEEKSNEMEGELICRTRWYSKVKVKGAPGLIGKKVDVLIDDIDGVVLSGAVINI